MANKTFVDVLKPNKPHKFVKDVAKATGISAIKVNKILVAKGFQKKCSDGTYRILNDPYKTKYTYVTYVVGYNNRLKKTMVFTLEGFNEAVKIIKEELHGN